MKTSISFIETHVYCQPSHNVPLTDFCDFILLSFLVKIEHLLVKYTFFFHFTKLFFNFSSSIIWNIFKSIAFNWKSQFSFLSLWCILVYSHKIQYWIRLLLHRINYLNSIGFLISHQMYVRLIFHFTHRNQSVKKKSSLVNFDVGDPSRPVHNQSSTKYTLNCLFSFLSRFTFYSSKFNNGIKQCNFSVKFCSNLASPKKEKKLRK